MLSKPLAEALATWAQQRRGWDLPGSLAQLAKVRDRNEDDTAMAWVRFCADPQARTPGAFPNPNGPHWKERVSPTGTGPLNPRPDEACRTCGKHIERCRCDQPTQRPAPSAVAADHIRSVRAIYDATRSELCGHGVPRLNCVEHFEPSTETTHRGDEPPRQGDHPREPPAATDAATSQASDPKENE